MFLTKEVLSSTGPTIVNPYIDGLVLGAPGPPLPLQRHVKLS